MSRGALGTALLSAEENKYFKCPVNAIDFQFQQRIKKTIQKEVNVLFVIPGTKSKRKKVFWKEKLWVLCPLERRKTDYKLFP